LGRYSRACRRRFKALAAKGVYSRAVTTTETLIDDAYSELVVRTRHTLYGLNAR
jgi:aspartate kinase